MVIQFSYQEYYWNLLIISMIFFVIGVVSFITSIHSFIKRLSDFSSIDIPYWKRLTRVLPKVLFLILSVIMISASLHNLKYGIDLIYEKSNFAVTYTGRVTAIKKDDLSPRYYDEEGNVLRASIVKIDSSDYYFMDAEELSIGDIIQITYLPSSTVVLSYQVRTEIDITDHIMQPIRGNSKGKSQDYGFIICFGILFLIVFVYTRNKKLIKGGSNDDWNKDEIRKRKSYYQKWAMFIITVLLIGILYVFLMKDLNAIFIFIVFVGFSTGYFTLSYKNEYILYDDKGIVVSSLVGKRYFISYSQIKSIEDTVKTVRNMRYRLIIIKYVSEQKTNCLLAISTSNLYRIGSLFELYEKSRSNYMSSESSSTQLKLMQPHYC